MTVRLLGDHPLAKDNEGRLKSRIGTVFPKDRVVITQPPVNHMTQREAYLDLLDRERVARGDPPLTRTERSARWYEAVDLVMEPPRGAEAGGEAGTPAGAGMVFIRPDPDQMTLAFEADELLRELDPPVAPWQVQFHAVGNAQVRQAIRLRGQLWRIAPLPQSPEEMQQMIQAAKTKLGGLDIYYYNKTTGTRLLTCDEFKRLGQLESEDLRRHLREIQEFSGKRNPLGNPEVAFFLAGDKFSHRDLAGYDLAGLDPEGLARAHAALAGKFCGAVPDDVWHDDPGEPTWRSRMFAALIGERDEVVADVTMQGLSSEFFMQIEWLPGARFDQGELLVDPCFLEPPPGAGRGPRCEQNTLAFIFNFVREFGDLEYVNIGHVIGSMSRGRRPDGRREVYIAVLKTPGSEETVKIIRMQKRGVQEHLDNGEDLLQALLKSDGYTEYILDRRLACRQLGMNLTQRILARKVSETYHGQQQRYDGLEILSPYFERDYISGIASDKIPPSRYQKDGYALRLATLLGRAAAPNLIVGRCDAAGGAVVFDDGDELVVETAAGLPAEIVLADQMGSFNNCTMPLVKFAQEYARPVNRRTGLVSDPAAFAAAYLEGFLARFQEIQEHYRCHKSAFDALFGHRRLASGKSIALRWAVVLRRLDKTKPQELVTEIRKHLDSACGK